MAAPGTNSSKDLAQEKSSLSFKIDNLRDEASLKSTIDGFTDLDSLISNLPIRVQNLRQRNYVFDGMLEKIAVDIGDRFNMLHSEIESKISMQANMLQSSMRSIEIRFNALGAFPSATSIQLLSSEAEQFEDRCDSAKRTIESLYENIKSEANQFGQKLGELECSLDKAESASFGFLPTEAIVKAVKAIWCKSGKEEKDDPEGNLFLTDQRLIFEQNEEVATKKVLFVTTESQKIQQLLFEVPVVSIEDIESKKLGIFKNQDMLELRFAPGSFSAQAVLHIYNQSCEEWQKMITSVKNHEYDSKRVIAIDAAAVEKVKKAPTQCPQCGGLITKPVLRGMDTITCEFCGKVIRL